MPASQSDGIIAQVIIRTEIWIALASFATIIIFHHALFDIDFYYGREQAAAANPPLSRSTCNSNVTSER